VATPTERSLVLRMTIEDTLLALLDAVQQLASTDATPPSERVSSVEIADNPTKELKVRITTKHYVGSPLTREMVDAMLDVHGYAHREANRRAMLGWEQALEGIIAQTELGTNTTRKASGPSQQPDESDLEPLPDFGPEPARR
jgi:hypothetical protein